MTHLIDQDQRVHGLGLLQTLDHLPGHGSHVGPPVSLDFWYIIHPSNTKPIVLQQRPKMCKTIYSSELTYWLNKVNYRYKVRTCTMFKYVVYTYLSPQGPCYGFGYACFPYTRGTLETQNLPLRASFQLTDCDEFLQKNVWQLVHLIWCLLHV